MFGCRSKDLQTPFQLYVIDDVDTYHDQVMTPYVTLLPYTPIHRLLLYEEMTSAPPQPKSRNRREERRLLLADWGRQHIRTRVQICRYLAGWEICKCLGVDPRIYRPLPKSTSS